MSRALVALTILAWLSFVAGRMLRRIVPEGHALCPSLHPHERIATLFRLSP